MGGNVAVKASCASILLSTLLATVNMSVEGAFDEDQIVVLRAPSGAEAHILTFGAIIQSLIVPDREGILSDVALGFDSIEPYQNGSSPYFGATVGRVGNRIANGTFKLDGKSYQTPLNDGPNDLHGGFIGWSSKQWTVISHVNTTDGQALVLGLTSPNGDQGFPGTVNATVRFTLSSPATLTVEFSAASDAPTPINMVQHTYFNLDGVAKPGTILNHTAAINASYITPVNDVLIPTGEFQSVTGTPFDFGIPKKIGDRVSLVPGPTPKGYDINYVLWGYTGPESAQLTENCTILTEPSRAATISSEASGRNLNVYTTSPGLQFYTGNQLKGDLYGKNGVQYVQYGGFATETQVFPDFMNQPNFAKCILEPGQTYESSVIFEFTTTNVAVSG